MKMKKFAAVITFAISIPTVQASSLSFNLFAYVPLKCETGTNNDMSYGLLFKDSADHPNQFNSFSVNSNGRSVSFFIDNARVNGLTSPDGSLPIVFFEDDKGRKLTQGSPTIIKSNGTGKYNFRFKIKTDENKNFYRANNKQDASVAASITFACNI